MKGREDGGGKSVGRSAAQLAAGRFISEVDGGDIDGKVTSDPPRKSLKCHLVFAFTASTGAPQLWITFKID